MKCVSFYAAVGLSLFPLLSNPAAAQSGNPAQEQRIKKCIDDTINERYKSTFGVPYKDDTRKDAEENLKLIKSIVRAEESCLEQENRARQKEVQEQNQKREAETRRAAEEQRRAAAMPQMIIEHSKAVKKFTDDHEKKGVEFAQKVSKNWNVKDTTNKLTMEKISELKGTQKDADTNVRFETTAKCDKGGADFTVDIFNAKNEAVRPISAFVVNNGIKSEIPIKVFRESYTRQFFNQVDLGHFFHDLPKYEKNAEILHFLQSHPNLIYLNRERDIQRFITLINKHGFKDTSKLELFRYLDPPCVFRQPGEQEICRNSWGFIMVIKSGEGESGYYLPFYNTVVRNFLKSCEGR